jgi:hypothetical protein
MAKTTGAHTSSAPTSTSAETRLEAFAEDLGRLLGDARNKADSWLAQRDAIAKHLEGVRDTATHLLDQLGAGGHRQGRPPAERAAASPDDSTGRPKGSGRRKRRTMSAEAREKIAAAQRARWAKQKAGKK